MAVSGCSLDEQEPSRKGKTGGGHHGPLGQNSPNVLSAKGKPAESGNGDGTH